MAKGVISMISVFLESSKMKPWNKLRMRNSALVAGNKKANKKEEK